MSPEQWNKIVELFHAARAKTPTERAALLDSASAADPELRLAVEQMLRDDEASYSLLDRSPHPRQLVRHSGGMKSSLSSVAEEWAKSGPPMILSSIVRSR